MLAQICQVLLVGGRGYLDFDFSVAVVDVRKAFMSVDALRAVVLCRRRRDVLHYAVVFCGIVSVEERCAVLNGCCLLCVGVWWGVY